MKRVLGSPDGWVMRPGVGCWADGGAAEQRRVLRAAWPRVHRPGQLRPLYLILSSTVRHGCEQTRHGFTGGIAPWFPAMAVGQVACVTIALGGLVAPLILQWMPCGNPLAAMAVAPPEAAPALLRSVPSGSRAR